MIPLREATPKALTHSLRLVALKDPELTMPVLAIGGEKSLGNELGAQMKLVADNVEVIVLPNTGHWILEERPKETTEALVNFL